MPNKSSRLNVISSQALGSNSTITSGTQSALFEKGLRLYITVSGVTAGGGTDSIFLCAIPPGTTTPIQLTGIAGVNYLATAGTFVIDFTPNTGLPGSLAAAQLLGLISINVPIQWAVRLKTAAGNSCTVKVDAELYP
jgi:hypothetical protein